MADIVGEQLGMIYAEMMILRDVQHVVSSKAVSLDDRLWPNLLANYRKRRSGGGVWDDDDMHLAAPFQQSEYRYFPAGATPPLTLAVASEVALVDRPDVHRQ